ncbi:MAG: SGNH/GDSL hydrolase family protein, partial [Bacteroidia bacterium]
DEIFKQPLVNAGVGINLDSNAKLVLSNSTFCYGNALTPVYAAHAGDISNFNWIGDQGPFNNIGVPGLRIYQINDQFLGNPQAGNPFYARFVKMQDNDHTILSDISEFNASFFTYWMGMDDLLPFALSGGINFNDPIAKSDFQATFDSYIETMIKTLTANKAKGAMANIPQILDFPYFTTVPYNGVLLTSVEAADINAILSHTNSNIQFHEGNNPFVIDDSTAPNGKRFITSEEFILLNVPLDSIKCFHYGTYDLQAGKLISIPDQYVITEAEAHLIRQRIIDFNAKIKEEALANDLAYVDMYDVFRQIDVGIKFNNVTFSFEYLHGGTFSLDGVHLTAKGNAFVANEFVKAINAQYGADFRETDINSYPGIKFP